MEQRADKPQCGFGLLGLCCLDCAEGPCRIDPFGKGNGRGVCGRPPEIIVMKNLLRRLATGAALSANYARQLVLDGLAGGEGEVSPRPKGAKKRDREPHVRRVDKTHRIAQKALEDFSRQTLAPLNWVRPNVANLRFEVLAKRDVIPHNIDAAITKAVGAGEEVNELYLTGVRCSLANLGTLHLVSDLAAALGKTDLSGWCSRRDLRWSDQGREPRTRDGRLRKPLGTLGDSQRKLLAESMLGGELSGIALFLGCGGLSPEELSTVEEFAKNDILSVYAGCSLDGHGPVDRSHAGSRLMSLVKRIGNSLGRAKAPSVIVDLAHCLETLRMMELVRDLANRLGVDSDSIPLLAIVGEKTDERIEVMAHWMMALGIPVYWTRIPPLAGSPISLKMYTETMKSLFGGYAIWEKSPGALAELLGKRSRMIGLR